MFDDDECIDMFNITICSHFYANECVKSNAMFLYPTSIYMADCNKKFIDSTYFNKAVNISVSGM